MYVLISVFRECEGRGVHWCVLLHKPDSRKEVLWLLVVESPGSCNMMICGISDLVYSFGVIIICCLGYTLSLWYPLPNL
jgi:hypothetical protein